MSTRFKYPPRICSFAKTSEKLDQLYDPFLSLKVFCLNIPKRNNFVAGVSFQSTVDLEIPMVGNSETRLLNFCHFSTFHCIE